LQILFLFLFGVILGSFLNVLILRYELGGAVFGRQLKGRSRCPHCNKALSWYELMPIISFIIQFGKCRNCREKISLQYPVVEIISGVIVATIPQILGFTPLALIWAIALLVLLIISFIDARHYVIPDVLTIIIVLLGIAATAIIAIGDTPFPALIPGTFLGDYAFVFSFTDNPWLLRLAAAFVGGAFFSSIILLSRGKAMGWGDAKLIAAIGILIGWPDALLVMMIAFITGATVGIIMLVGKKKKIKDALPFGPFIAFGVMMVVYFGYDIISLYFRFLYLGV